MFALRELTKAKDPKVAELGRKALDENFEPKIEVIKGSAGPVAEDPYRVDGLSGATITARGVTNMMHFWLGEEALGPYLERVRQRKGAVANVG